MKKFLALLLVLCTLLCLFPVAVSAEEGDVSGAESETTGTYLDLYVKEGLVALYDAYGATASADAATTWTAVDFYGKEGYDSYLNPAEYAATLTPGAYLAWKWEDGHLLHYAYNDNGATTTRDDVGSFIDLNALGAALITDAASQLTVQTVYQLLGGPTADASLSTPVIEDGVVTNSATLGTTYKFTYGGGLVVCDLSNQIGWHANIYDGGFSQMGGWRVDYDGLAIDKCIYFFGEYYNVLPGNDLTDAAGNSLAGKYVARGDTGIIVETVSRVSSTSYHVDYRNGLLYPNGSVFSNWDCTLAEPAGANTLKLQIGLRNRAFSVRVYDVVLDKAMNDQNHLADLLGFYGVDANFALALTAEELAELAAATADIAIAKNADEYDDLKAELKAAILPFDKEAMKKAARLELYVKDGLVALFDAYDAEAQDGYATSWAPVDLSGRADYPDYFDVVDYTLSTGSDEDGDSYTKNLDWKWENGYLSLVSVKAKPYLWGNPRCDDPGAYFDLNSLGAALMGEGASGLLTVQEVYQLTGPSWTENDAAYPVIVDGVMTNSESYMDFTYKGQNWGILAYGGGTTVGGFDNQLSYHMHFSGVKSMFGAYFYQMQAANTGKSGAHQYLITNYYGYTSSHEIKRADGETLLEGYYLPVKAMGVLESTVIRESATAYKFHLQNGVYHWHEGAATTDFDFTATANLTSTSLLTLKGMPLNAYSVRVYNKVLDEVAINQNHLADLVNFYKIDVTGIEVLSTEELALLGETVKVNNLARTLDTTDEEYVTEKTAVEEAVNAAIAAATEEFEAVKDAALSFGDIAYRTSGDYGVRALFTVDVDAIASLESRGFTVTYGALVGVGSNGETVVNESAEALTVGIDAETGLVAIATGTGKALATDSDEFLHLTDDYVSFALSTVFAADGTQSDYYATTLLYRGFVVLEKNGDVTVVYDEVVVDGLTDISLISVHEKALTDTTDMSAELIERLEAVLPAEE